MKRISTVGPKSCGDWIGYDRPVQFLDHLTVIKRESISGAPHIVNNQHFFGGKKPRKSGNTITESGHGSSQISVVEDYASDRLGKSGVSFRDGNDDLENEISKYLEKVQGTSN